jgi:hypothetical protein
MNKLVQMMVILMTIFAVVLSGCAGTVGTSEPDTVTPTSTIPGISSSTTSTVNTQPSGQEAMDIINASVVAVAKIKTVKMVVDSNMIMEVTGGSQPGKMTMHQVMSGSVDNTAKKMLITMNVNMDVPYQGKQDVKADMYAADGWIYMKYTMAAAGEQWMKMKLTDDIWKEQSGVSNMAEFLQSAKGATLQGSEKVNGIDCYILEVVPDTNILAGWVKDQLQSSQAGLDLSQTDMTKTFKQISIKEWIAKDSKMLMQEQMALVTEMKPEQMGTPAGSFDKMVMDINMSMNYSNFDQPVSVVIPPEAKDAQDISAGQ